MAKFQCFTKAFCCPRRWSYFGVVSVTLSMTSLVILMEDTLQRKHARSDVQAPLWILPGDSSLSSKSLSTAIPARWAVYLPKRHHNISCPSCHHEDDETFSWLANNWPGGSVETNLVTRTSLRKMARLLFVVQHGASGVLITSHLRSVNQSIPRLILDNQPDGVVGMEYAGRDVTTDSFHFHHRTQIIDGNPCKYYRLRRRMKLQWTVGIRCRSLTVQDAASDVQTVFYTDPHAPPVFASKPKFGVESLSDAFFEYKGFWALFISIFPMGSKVSLWTLWAQRMLQEIHGEMALTSLHCPLDGNHAAPAELQPNNMMKSLHSFLTNWNCGFEMKFYECAILLATDLLSAELIDSNNVKLLKLWFKSLHNSGYPEPKRKFFKVKRDNNFRGCVVHSPAPIPHPSNDIPTNFIDSNKTQLNFPHIYPLCKDLPKREEVVDPFAHHAITKPSTVRDIALVIIFYDSSIYTNIQFLHDIYSHYFPYLIYCGPDWKLFQAFYKTFQTPLTYIEVPNTKGFVAYECVSRAIMMNYDVNGYLEMADDVILNTWSLQRIPRDKFWFQKDLKIASRHQQIMHDFALPYPFPWWPWTVHGQMWGSKAMAKVWNKFGYILQSSSNDTRTQQIVKAFLDTLRHNSGNSENFFYCSSDIFYVPNKFRQEWAWLSEIFFSSNVFLDIAVPTLMNGMDWTGNIIRMEGVYLWYNNRGNYPAYYRDFHQFFHPWKMGWIHRQDHANFLCYHVLPHIVTDRTNATVQTIKNTDGLS